MIVLDASAVVEFLVGGECASLIQSHLALHGEWIAPHILDVEVLSALRNLAAGRKIDPTRCDQLLTDLAALPAQRYPHTALLARVWELRHNFTPYDATYIALAEATGSVLYTCDEKLRRGHRAKVFVFKRKATPS
jgi:predicted nucleic acid-binding protein